MGRGWLVARESGKIADEPPVESLVASAGWFAIEAGVGAPALNYF